MLYRLVYIASVGTQCIVPITLQSMEDVIFYEKSAT